MQNKRNDQQRWSVNVFFHRFTGSEKLGQTLKVSAEEAKGFMESFLGLLKILS